MSIIDQYIREGEHERQDFKFSIEDQKKIARTLAAFANTSGGRLLIGVKDNGKIAGCLVEEEMYMVEGAADLYVNPPIQLKFEDHLVGHKRVLEVRIEKELERRKAPDEEGNWRYYTRMGDHTVRMNKILLKWWHLGEKKPSRPSKWEEAALVLLRILGTEELTISQLYKKSNLPKKTVDYWIPLFLHWGLVKVAFREPSLVFRSAEAIED